MTIDIQIRPISTRISTTRIVIRISIYIFISVHVFYLFIYLLNYFVFYCCSFIVVGAIIFIILNYYRLKFWILKLVMVLSCKILKCMRYENVIGDDKILIGRYGSLQERGDVAAGSDAGWWRCLRCWGGGGGSAVWRNACAPLDTSGAGVALA